MYLGNGDGFAPTLVGVTGLENDVAHVIDQGDDEVESLVAFTIFNIGRVNTTCDAKSLLERNLRVLVQDVTAEIPIYQVSAVPDRNAWPIDKRAVRHIEVVTLAADRGVGVGSRDDRIQILGSGIERYFVSFVITHIGEAFEEWHRVLGLFHLASGQGKYYG